MIDESLPRALLAVKNVMDQPYRLDGKPPTWFISFGALRYFCTDRLLGKPFDQDIDISVLSGEVDHELLEQSFVEYGYRRSKQVLDPKNGRPYQMVFETDASLGGPGGVKRDIDVWFWVQAGPFYWHTYDHYNTGAEVLPKYTYKGVPRKLFDAGVWQAIWEDTAAALNFPEMFGSLLDLWYPPQRDPNGSPVPNTGWIYQQRNYGQSRTPHKIEALCYNDLIKKVSLTE